MTHFVGKYKKCKYFHVHVNIKLKILDMDKLSFMNWELVIIELTHTVCWNVFNTCGLQDCWPKNVLQIYNVVHIWIKMYHFRSFRSKTLLVVYLSFGWYAIAVQGGCQRTNPGWISSDEELEHSTAPHLSFLPGNKFMKQFCLNVGLLV